MSNKPAKKTERKADRVHKVSDRTKTKPSSKVEEGATSAKAGETLTKTEKGRLQQLEATIGSGLGFFVEVGRALSQINTERLYREESDTFEDFCERKWDMSRQYGYRLMKAAECYDLLESKLPSGTRLPSNESQLRPMVEVLKPSKWVEAWKTVIADTLGTRMTAEAVEKVVHGLGGKSSRPKPEVRKKARSKVSTGLAKVVDIIETALENKRATIKDLQKSLRSIRNRLKALQLGSQRSSE